MTEGVHPMVPVPEALKTVLKQSAAVRIQHAPEPVTMAVSPHGNLKELLHHTLACDVVMQEPGYPNYDASIMDGYAICANDKFDGRDTDKWTHAIVDRIHAGDESNDTQEMDSQQERGLPRAVYITTGAVVPKGYNCVVPIEDCRVSSTNKEIGISKDAVIQDGKWIRKVGCDMAAGSIVLSSGTVLDPVGLGLLLQSGVKQVELKPRIKVGVLSTGNELIHPGDEVVLGRIPDVNRPILLSLLETFGNAIPIDLGMERDDDVNVLTGTIGEALERCDVIITTGGISMGETDIVEEVLVDKLGGTLHFGRMHMKPGKPTTFVTIGTDKLVFAMPGNPVSATVCTQLLVRPALDLLYHGPDKSADSHGESFEDMLDRMVQNAWVHPEIRAALAHDIKLDKERPEYRRVTLTTSHDGTFLASSTGVQRSSRLQSLRDAEGLLVLPQGGVEPSDKTVAKAGEVYTVLLLNNFDLRKRVQVCNSSHLQRKKRREVKVSLIRVENRKIKHDDPKILDALSDRVCESLSGTKSGVARVASSNTFMDGQGQDLFDTLDTKHDVDIYVISCPSFEGSFSYYLDLTSCLRQRLDKVADTMALQARRGAASQDPKSALFEVVVGFFSFRDNGAMLICLPESGLEGGLQNVRGLLKHALQVARS